MGILFRRINKLLVIIIIILLILLGFFYVMSIMLVDDFSQIKVDREKMDRNNKTVKEYFLDNYSDVETLGAYIIDKQKNGKIYEPNEINLWLANIDDLPQNVYNARTNVDEMISNFTKTIIINDEVAGVIFIYGSEVPKGKKTPTNNIEVCTYGVCYIENEELFEKWIDNASLQKYEIYDCARLTNDIYTIVILSNDISFMKCKLKE